MRSRGKWMGLNMMNNQREGLMREKIVEVAASYARVRNFIREMANNGEISRESERRYQDDIKLLIQEATNHPSPALTGADL